MNTPHLPTDPTARPPITRRAFLKSLMLVGLSTLPISTHDTLSLEVNHVKIRLNLGRRLRIGIVTDAHLHTWGPWESRLKSLLDSVAKSVDLMVVLGDMYDSATPDLDLLPKLLSLKVPSMGVLGNHEIWADKQGFHSLSHGLEVYEEAGVTVLRNEVVSFKGVKVGGVGWLYSIDPKLIDELGEVDVLLSHTPDIVAFSPRAKLILSGHTHGGQICLPFEVPLFVPSRFGTKYSKGLHRVGPSHLYVSKGVGESYVLPMRTFCRRELTVIELS